MLEPRNQYQYARDFNVQCDELPPEEEDTEGEER